MGPNSGDLIPDGPGDNNNTFWLKDEKEASSNIYSDNVLCFEMYEHVIKVQSQYSVLMGVHDICLHQNQSIV